MFTLDCAAGQTAFDFRGPRDRKLRLHVQEQRLTWTTRHFLSQWSLVVDSTAPREPAAGAHLKFLWGDDWAPSTMPLCPFATLGQELYVSQSRIPEAGQGLFTRRFFPAHAIVTMYDGELRRVRKVTDKDGIPTPDTSHFRSVPQLDMVVNGLKKVLPDRGGGSFVNHDEKNLNCRFAAAEFGNKYLRWFFCPEPPPMWYKIVPTFLVATKDIQPGDEVRR